jgi:hypothetical protein
MQIIQHRINTTAELATVPLVYGVELDLRDKYDKIVVQHDAFKDGEDWKDYLKTYRHQFLIANVKTEGIEEQLINDLAAQEINHYFLLDVSLPFLVKLSNKGFSKMAVRFSEREPIELAMQFAGKVDWLWVDCFTHLPLHKDNYALLKKYFKICIVSPELHGHPISLIQEFKEQLKGMEIDAVCTKKPESWQRP